MRKRQDYDSENLIDQIREEIKSRLPDKDISGIAVSQALGIELRTMQRRLEEQKTSFSSLVSGVRQELAKEYFKQPGLSINDIAKLLGYSNLCAFSRAFKNVNGIPPSEFRKTL